MALILVTGASTGLGLATARTLADDGHQVVLHVRRVERVEDPDLLAAVQEVVEADLADLDATVALAGRLDGIGRFDAVVHNAGVMRGPEVLGVNVVAPYVLSALMRPPGRAVFLSSSMHLSGTPDLERLGPAGGASYSDSKLVVTALALELAQRRPGTLSHAVDPGWVPTRMGGAGAPDDLDEGHRTQAWLAVADEAEIRPRTGGYWRHRATREPHAATRDAAFRAGVVGRLEEWTGIPLDP